MLIALWITVFFITYALSVYSILHIRRNHPDIYSELGSPDLFFANVEQAIKNQSFIFRNCFNPETDDKVLNSLLPCLAAFEVTHLILFITVAMHVL
jgi:hypothetical protein